MNTEKIYLNGQEFSIKELAGFTGIPESTIRTRLKRKMSLDDILTPAGRDEPSICWDCKNSVPSECYGCSWSREFKPVRGWIAQKTHIKSDEFKAGKRRQQIVSYNVRKCPHFIHD